jgi:hypothetical protein
MVLFVMLNLFTWLKSKVNIHSFKIQLEETIPFSEIGVCYPEKQDYIIFYFINLSSIEFLKFRFLIRKLGNSVTYGF